MPFLRASIGSALVLRVLACRELTTRELTNSSGMPEPRIGHRLPTTLACESTSTKETRDTLLIDGAGQFPVSLQLLGGGSVVVFRGKGSHVSLSGRLDIARLDSLGTLEERIIPAGLDSPLDDRNPAMGLAPGLGGLARVLRSLAWEHKRYAESRLRNVPPAIRALLGCGAQLDIGGDSALPRHRYALRHSLRPDLGQRERRDAAIDLHRGAPGVAMRYLAARNCLKP